MSIIRLLFTYLARNEHVLNKLADSKPIRRSAQLMAYLLLRFKSRALPFQSKIKEKLKKNSPK